MCCLHVVNDLSHILPERDRLHRIWSVLRAQDSDDEMDVDAAAAAAPEAVAHVKVSLKAEVRGGRLRSKACKTSDLYHDIHELQSRF